MELKNSKFSLICVSVSLIAIVLFPAQSQVFSKANLPSKDNIEFQGKIITDKDISAIGFVGKYILL